MINSNRAYLQRARELHSSHEVEFGRALQTGDPRVMLAILSRQRLQREGMDVPNNLNEILNDFDTELTGPKKDVFSRNKLS
jgi:hypothetical protein